MTRAKHGFLHDEQGDRSYARLGLTYTLIFTAAVITADTAALAILSRDIVPAAVWPLLTTAMVGFMAWAGGRAMARYFGPQAAGMVQGVAAAARKYVADDELPRVMLPDPA